MMRRDLDDMGLIYVRHGEPDNWMNYSCEDCIQNFSWHYYESINKREMIFHFIKHGPSRGWLLESMPTYFENRWELGYPYRFIDPTRGENFETEDIRMYYQWMNKVSKQDVKVGIRSETSDFEFEAEPLTVPIQFLTFKGEDGLTKVELYYGLQGADIDLIAEKGRTFIKLNKFIGIYDQYWDTAYEVKEREKFSISVSQEAWASSVVMQMENFQTKPGYYFYEIQIEDEASGRLAAFKDTCIIRNYMIDSLTLSDIILSSTLKFGERRGLFRKGDLTYSPHMFTQYEQDETVGLYFEVYNLVFDQDDRTRYQAKWTLSRIEVSREVSFWGSIWQFFEDLFSGETDTVTSTLEYDGITRDDKVYFNLVLQDQDSGRYELLINVKDKISSMQASRRVEFVIK
jgi:hypothetical protein